MGAAACSPFARKLLDVDDGGRPPTAAPRWRRLCPCPHAALATLLYALWPAGVAMSSVVGTDMPAAALLAARSALLVTLAPRRPWHAAVAFGAGDGPRGLGARGGAAAVGARAGYWLARARARCAGRLALTAVGRGDDADRAAAVGHPARAPERPALLHRRSRRHHRAHRRQPELGGDVHARAQPHSSRTSPGESVLDEPHRQTDRAAYAIAREWIRFEPALRAGAGGDEGRSAVRSRAPPALLADLPPGRAGGPPGAVLRPPPRRDRRVRRRFGLAIVALALAGIAVALARRRWRAARPWFPSSSRWSRPTPSSSRSLATGCRSSSWRSRSWRWRWRRRPRW